MKDKMPAFSMLKSHSHYCVQRTLKSSLCTVMLCTEYFQARSMHTHVYKGPAVN